MNSEEVLRAMKSFLDFSVVVVDLVQNSLGLILVSNFRFGFMVLESLRIFFEFKFIGV